MFKLILNWSEVWALLIPLTFIIIKGKNIPLYLKPIRIYVWVALILNVAADLLRRFKIKWGFHDGDLLWSNNFLYNTHSIARLLLFSYFFILLKQRFMHRVKVIIPVLFVIFVIVNFTFHEKYFDYKFSSLLLATEAALLLFYCLQYFIYLLLEDRQIPLKKQPGFWIVIGLSIYISVSFFIFLFYNYIMQYMIQKKWKSFAVDIWDVHNIVYIFLCICIARAFYERSS